MHNDFKCLNLTLQQVGKILNFEVSLHFIIMISRGRRVLSFLRLAELPDFLTKRSYIKEKKKSIYHQCDHHRLLQFLRDRAFLQFPFPLVPLFPLRILLM